MNSGVYIGIGYIITEQERTAMLNNIITNERRNEIIDCMHRISPSPSKYLLGEIIADMPEGSAHSIESLAALPGLTKGPEFGLKYGLILYDCGLSPEEINKNWANPNIYFVHWVDC